MSVEEAEVSKLKLQAVAIVGLVLLALGAVVALILGHLAEGSAVVFLGSCVTGLLVIAGVRADKGQTPGWLVAVPIAGLLLGLSAGGCASMQAPSLGAMLQCSGDIDPSAQAFDVQCDGHLRLKCERIDGKLRCTLPEPRQEQPALPPVSMSLTKQGRTKKRGRRPRRCYPGDEDHKEPMLDAFGRGFDFGAMITPGLLALVASPEELVIGISRGALGGELRIGRGQIHFVALLQEQQPATPPLADWPEEDPIKN